jgi:hypothetical protein
MNAILLLALTAKNSVAPAVISVALAVYAVPAIATQVSAFTATRAMEALAESVTFALVPLVTLLYVVAGTVKYAPFLLVIDICKILVLLCIYLIDTGSVFVLH